MTHHILRFYWCETMIPTMLKSAGRSFCLLFLFMLLSPFLLLHWLCGDFKEFQQRRNEVTKWSLLALFLGCLVVSLSARPALPPLPSLPAVKPALITPRQRANLRAAAPRFTVTRLTISCAVPPGARGYLLETATNELRLFPTVQVIDPLASFQISFTNEFRQRPARWWFSIAAFNSTNTSGYVEFHWPPFPQIVTGTGVSWGEVLPVTIETSADLVTWQILTNVVSDHFDHVPEPLPGQLFYRTVASRPLTLTARPILKPDARDL